MVLLRKTFKPSRISKTWDKIRTWGTRLLVGGLFLGTPANMVAGCTEAKQEQSELDKTGILITPPSTNVIQDENGNFYMADRIIIGVIEIDDRRILEITRRYNGRITVRVPGTNMYEIEVNGDINQIISELQNNGFVRYAERNYFFRSAGKPYEGCSVPAEEVECSKELDNDCLIESDELWAESLWWHEKIQLSEAYRLLRERGIELPEVTVAVLDTSFQLDNPELRDRFVDKRYHLNAANPGLLCGANILCDKTDVTPSETSWNEWFANDQGFLGDWTRRETHALHGTAVSAIIAAENSGSKINGVAFNAKILPIKFSSEHLFTDELIYNLQRSVEDFVEDATGLLFGVGVDAARFSAALNHIADYAGELNIVAINFSIGGEHSNRSIREAIEKVPDDIIIIASAGNFNRRALEYPAAYSTKVISVGGTMKDPISGSERRWIESDGTLGSNYSDITTVAAPAREVLSVSKTSKDGEESCISKHAGTSFSAPMVSGLVALMKSINPDLTHDQVVSLLTAEGNYDPVSLDNDPVQELHGKTWKRINVYKTLRAMLGSETNLQNCRELGQVEGRKGFSLSNGKIVFQKVQRDEETGHHQYQIHDIETGLTEDLPFECKDKAVINADKVVCLSSETSGFSIYNLVSRTTQDILLQGPYSGRSISSFAFSDNYIFFTARRNVGPTVYNLHYLDITSEEITVFEEANPVLIESDGDTTAYVPYENNGIVRVFSVSGSLSSINPQDGGTIKGLKIFGNYVLFRSVKGEDTPDEEHTLYLANINDALGSEPIVIHSERPPEGTESFLFHGPENFDVSGEFAAYLPTGRDDIILYHIPSGEEAVESGLEVIRSTSYWHGSLQLDGRRLVYVMNTDDGIRRLVACDF